MRADATLKPAKPPRGLILSTGEDVPKGQSLRARMLVIETGKDALDWDKLTACQEDAANGLYAQAMAGYVRWLAHRYEEVRNSLKTEVDALRAEAHLSGRHRRTADLVANLGIGFRHFLAFAQESGAITQAEAHGLWQRCWRALGEAAEAQGAHQLAAEPATHFLELLSAAIVSGRAHMADKDGEAPSDWKRWGWRELEIGTGDRTRIEWRPQGRQVGWIDGQDLYLEANAAFAGAQNLGRDVGDSLTVLLSALKRRLKERGLLASTEQTAGRGWIDVRRTLQGQRRKVLHLDSNSLIPPERSQWSQSGDGSYLADPEMAPKDGSKTDNPPEFWSHEMEPDKGVAISENGDDGSKGSNTEHTHGGTLNRRMSL